MVILKKVVLGAFSHTAQHTNDKFAVLCLFHGIESVEAVINLLLRVVANGTRVQKHRVGTFNVLHRVISRSFHDRSNHFAVRHIHLAAVSFYIKFLHFLIDFGRKVTKL